VVLILLGFIAVYFGITVLPKLIIYLVLSWGYRPALDEQDHAEVQDSQIEEECGDKE
jgi:hypothetical protein